MPITFRVDDDARVVHAEITGALEAAEMVAGVRDIAALLAARPGHAVVTDQRGVARPATREQVDAVVHALMLHTAVLRDRRWAIVTALPASYGMMRALGVYAERIPITVAVFWDAEAATAWVAGGDGSAERGR